MKWRWSIIGGFVNGFWVGILTSYLSQGIAQNPLKLIFPKVTVQPLSQKELCQIAKTITVKVLNQESWGSGILISKKGDSKYSLLTNGHVLKDNKHTFTIETSDGQKHTASLLVRFDHSQAKGSDLAILQFDSYKPYKTAKFAQWTAPEKVMAAGFPLAPESSQSDLQGLTCTPLGIISRRLDKPMQNGYQLGYFLTVQNGMSGGPLLSDHGQVVGINGMAEPAIFINPDVYLYRDGKRVSETLGLSPDKALKLLSTSSWAISAETFVDLAPQGLKIVLRTTINYHYNQQIAKIQDEQTIQATPIQK